jgi:hypothetical protein
VPPLVRRALALAALPLAGAIAHACAGSGCQCPAPREPAMAERHALAVFRGTVIDLIDTTVFNAAARRSDPGVAAAIRVEASWKGPLDSVIVVLTRRPSEGCGVPFRTGERYLVYAVGYRDDLQTSACLRTRRVADATEDLTSLGAPRWRGRRAPDPPP